MRDKKMKALVTQDKRDFCGKFPDELRMQEEKKKLAKCVAEKQIRYCPGIARLIAIQLRYIGKGTWAAWGIMLALLVLLERMGSSGKLGDFSMLGLAAVWLIFSAVLGVYGIARLVGNHMGELEAVCYFNLGQLFCVRMALYGAVDLGLLVILTDGLGAQTKIGMALGGMYLLMVFLLTNIVYVLVFTFVRGRGQLMALVMAALLLSVAVEIPILWTEILLSISYGGWAVMLAAGVVVLALEVRQVFHNIEKGEIICID